MSEIVCLAGVEKTYQAGQQSVHALQGVDLSIKAGEFVVIQGRSGSGKSTLLNVLGCLDRPDRGHYRLRGEAVDTLDDEKLSALRNLSLGMVFQGFHLLPHLTIVENVLLPLRFTPKHRRRPDFWSVALARADELLATVGLADRAQHKPRELSGGQQQRVAIARALINQPELLLADEPTGNLDSATARSILHLFARLNAAGQTVVMVTHADADWLGSGCRHVFMQDGRIISDRRSGAMLSGRSGRFAGASRTETEQ